MKRSFGTEVDGNEHFGDAAMVTLMEIAAATLVVGYTATYLTMRHLFPPARS
jgi:hypothetical protein